MPLTEKGREIRSAMTEQYGKEKGEQVFYASKNKGRITGVDRFRSTVRDAVASGVPVKDAIKQAVTATTRDAHRRTFRSSVRDAVAKGMPARDALAAAFGVRDDWSPQAREAAAKARAAHMHAASWHAQRAERIERRPGAGSQTARQTAQAHNSAMTMHVQAAKLHAGGNVRNSAYEAESHLHKHVQKTGIGHAPGYHKERFQ